MRMSELVRRSGVPLPTVKFYLREGLLMPGAPRGATQADYGEEHVRRLALVRALIEVVGLSVHRAREIIALVDSPSDDLYATLGKAVAALPPYASPADDHPRARAALERLGQVYDPRYAAVGQLERALAAAEAAGLPISDERLDAYGGAIRQLAAVDIGGLPAASPEDAVRYAVLGTALYEPVVVALRRLAHQDLAARTLTERGDPQLGR
jgi:DNA-binding transcriptional MerR regulator